MTRKPTPVPDETPQERRASRSLLDENAPIPPDGLPLDVFTEIHRCTPEQRAKVRAFILDIVGDGPIAYTADDIERLRSLVRGLPK